MMRFVSAVVLLIALVGNLAAQAFTPAGGGGYTQAAGPGSFSGDAGVTDGQIVVGGKTLEVFFIWEKVWVDAVDGGEPGHYENQIVLVLSKGTAAPNILTGGQNTDLQDLADQPNDPGIDITLGSNGQTITSFAPRPPGQ